MDHTLQVTAVEKAFATSDFYQLLSLSLRFPSEELVEVLIDGRYQQDGMAVLAELAVGLQERNGLQSLFAEMERLEQRNCFEEMRREYTRLFDDPKQPAIDIYETVFLGDKKKQDRQRILFCSSAARDAEQCYRDAGLSMINQYQEPADHIATELEFMMYLYGKQGRALQDQDAQKLEKVNQQIRYFEETHIKKWVFAFFDRLEQQTCFTPYQCLAKIAKMGLKQILH